MDLVFNVNLWIVLAFCLMIVGIYNLNKHIDYKRKQECKHSYIMLRECLNCGKKEIEDRDGGI